MIRKIIPIVAAMVLASSLSAQTSQQVELARQKIQKWVQTRQVISKERSDWRVQKESLVSTKELLEQELKEVEEKLANLSGNESAADARRAELTEEKEGLESATSSVRNRLADLEVMVRNISKRFPEAFLQQIDPLLRRIPEDPYRPGRATVGERLPNIVGIIQAAGKFNSTLHLFRETVPVEGLELQVDVLYWGMGIAYFVDQNNTYAGYKYPTDSGWKSQVMVEIAPQVRQIVDMYQRKNPNIEFVSLPVAIN
jgi:hypothetical protein